MHTHLHCLAHFDPRSQRQACDGSNSSAHAQKPRQASCAATAPVTDDLDKIDGAKVHKQMLHVEEHGEKHPAQPVPASVHQMDGPHEKACR